MSSKSSKTLIEVKPAKPVKTITQSNLLVSRKPSQSQNIVKIIKKATEIIADSSIISILKQNPYEKLVPFNLWFKSDLYSVVDNFENNQHMRLRFYNSCQLTPLVSYANNNLEPIKQLIPSLSLYQPFYPETFYAMWEFLQLRHLDINAKKFLHIGRETCLGSAEANIFFHERFQQTYQYNIYHSLVAGTEKYDIMDNKYIYSQPTINYLAQAYKIKFLESSLELIKYDFISIDCINILDDVFKWNNEELELQLLLFHLLTSLEHIVEDGSMLIRLNMIASKSWQIIFDITQIFFREYTLIRPSSTNIFNSEIYLFLNKFNINPWMKTIEYSFYKKLYMSNCGQGNTCQQLNLNIIDKPLNPSYQAYIITVQKWINELNIALDNFKLPSLTRQDLVSKWHTTNNLLQISNLTDNFENKSVYHTIKFVKSTSTTNSTTNPTTNPTTLAIKPILPYELFKQPFYKKLIEKRAELNYFKRIMDTKPSQIFTNRFNFNNKNSYLLSWEQLTNKIDEFRNLKFILRQQYNAEMVTNAWIKMYEMINMFSNLIPIDKKIKTFHLCEAPGAFISSLNHFLSNRNQELEWYGQTLKPTNKPNSTSNIALDDHYGLISSYQDKWLFGDPTIDDSGDITHSAIIRWYRQHKLLQDLDFMTSDAGLQCDPTELNEQEAYLSKINMGQIVCILACLPIGKSAIFKTFLPMSEPLTISMMYIITQLFELVSIVKPSTSHSSNSEVYIVATKYRGIKETTLEQLYVLLDDPKITSKTLLFSQIEKSFFDSYMLAVGNLIDRQIQSLSRSYYYYYHLDEIGKFNEITQKCTDDWLRVNPIFILKNPLLV